PMSRLLTVLACLSLGACASAPPLVEEIQRFQPGTDQLEAHYTRLTLPDGSSFKQGAAEQFYPDGKPMMKGSYEHGTPDGHWVTWFANGSPSREGDYVAGPR